MKVAWLQIHRDREKKWSPLRQYRNTVGSLSHRYSSLGRLCGVVGYVCRVVKVVWFLGRLLQDKYFPMLKDVALIMAIGCTLKKGVSPCLSRFLLLDVSVVPSLVALLSVFVMDKQVSLLNAANLKVHAFVAMLSYTFYTYCGNNVCATGIIGVGNHGLDTAPVWASLLLCWRLVVGGCFVEFCVCLLC